MKWYRSSFFNGWGACALLMMTFVMPQNRTCLVVGVIGALANMIIAWRVERAHSRLIETLKRSNNEQRRLLTKLAQVPESIEPEPHERVH